MQDLKYPFQPLEKIYYKGNEKFHCPNKYTYNEFYYDCCFPPLPCFFGLFFFSLLYYYYYYYYYLACKKFNSTSLDEHK